MARSLKEAYELARGKLAPRGLDESSGESRRGAAFRESPESPRDVVSVRGKGGRQREIPVSHGRSAGRYKPNQLTAPRKHKQNAEAAPLVAKEGGAKGPVAAGAVTKREGVSASRSALQVPKGYRISIDRDARFRLTTAPAVPFVLRKDDGFPGPRLQCHVSNPRDDRELTLGIDFGTSAVKVVIGDGVLRKAFAVPFGNGTGLSKFLLPSRLFETEGRYSLAEGATAYRDLKLSFAASPDELALQERVAAFLALVIRRARGWLLKEHDETYKRTRIMWRVAVGLPAAQSLNSDLERSLRRMVCVAWRVAEASEREVTADAVRSAMRLIPDAGSLEDDVEIAVIPEIAAQIYGFVVSTSFDKNAPNIFLMTDVGAGTVDASLFHVKPSGRGKWDFEFFTSVVEPNGVSNLHRDRVSWWERELTEAAAPRGIVEELRKSRLPTDQQGSVPESYLDYFDGVCVKPEAAFRSPDQVFFRERVLAQVKGKSFWRAWDNGLLGQHSLSDVPSFLCGGGMRMSFYNALGAELASGSGTTWLKARTHPLARPEDLVADDLPSENFDRLSVAYGLSRLLVGSMYKAIPKPRLVQTTSQSWTENYVSKDCM